MKDRVTDLPPAVLGASHRDEIEIDRLIYAISVMIGSGIGLVTEGGNVENDERNRSAWYPKGRICLVSVLSAAVAYRCVRVRVSTGWSDKNIRVW